MGIEPTPSAWKAEVLPLNYTRMSHRIWWRGKDSNLRRQSRQIYSLIPLTAREPLQNESVILNRSSFWVKFFSFNLCSIQLTLHHWKLSIKDFGQYLQYAMDTLHQQGCFFFLR